MGSGADESSQSVFRQIRALQTNATLTVYQAYDAEIADPALAAGRLVPPFKRDRMTWIKPSLLWMAYRSGWARKLGQERILAIEITREGFEWALTHACLSHFESATHANYEAWVAAKRVSPVRVQWDPERDLHLNALGFRAIQIGLSGEAVDRFVGEWTVSISDRTEIVQGIEHYVSVGDLSSATALLPTETPYWLPPDIAEVLGAT